MVWSYVLGLPTVRDYLHSVLGLPTVRDYLQSVFYSKKFEIFKNGSQSRRGNFFQNGLAFEGLHDLGERGFR